MPLGNNLGRRAAPQSVERPERVLYRGPVRLRWMQVGLHHSLEHFHSTCGLQTHVRGSPKLIPSAYAYALGRMDLPISNDH